MRTLFRSLVLAACLVMAVAFVKELGDATTSISTVTNVTIGNLILVVFDWDDSAGGGGPATLSGVTDNAAGGSNVYTQIGATLSGNLFGGTAFKSAAFWAKAKATATLTITPNFSAGTPTPEIYGQEWSGQDPSAPIDSSAQDVGTASTPTLTWSTIANACGIAVFAVPTSSSPGGPPTGYTQQSTFNGNDASTRTANKSPAGSETVTYTGPIDWMMHGIAIAPPAGSDVLFAQAVL